MKLQGIDKMCGRNIPNELQSIFLKVSKCDKLLILISRPFIYFMFQVWHFNQ